MNNNELKKLSFTKISIINGIIMLIIALLGTMTKDSIGYDNLETISGYIILYAVAYIYGIILLLVMLARLKELREFNQIYFVISLVAFILLCILWIPHYNIIAALLKGASLSQSSSFDELSGLASSVYNGYKDIDALQTGMYVFFANGIFHWIVRYFALFKRDGFIPEKIIDSVKEIKKEKNIHFKEKDVNLLEIYNLMNNSNFINPKDSKYWIFSSEYIFEKENNINKRYLIIKLFNRTLDKKDDLMRLYLNINGENIYQDSFEINKEYQNKNILEFKIERDLAEEESVIKIIGYIIDGKKFNCIDTPIGKIDIENNPLKLKTIKEFFFKDSENDCSNIPIISDNFWICSCGMYHTNEISCKYCGKTKAEVTKMTNFSKENILQNISYFADVDYEYNVDQLTERIVDYYSKNYELDSEKIRENIDKKILASRQRELVDKTIENMIKKDPIKYTSSLSFEENLDEYAYQHQKGIISKEMILKFLDLKKCKRDYKISLKKQKESKQGKLIIMAVGIICTCLIIGGIIFTSLKKPEFAVNQFSYVLNIGDNQRIEMENFNEDIEFVSSDKNIVEVSSNGELTAVDEGEATISVHDKSKEKFYSLYITVNPKNNPNSYDPYIDDTSMIFPNSDSVYLTENDLDGLSQWELRIARNEIYARHGCVFKDESLQQYFDNCDWYEPINISAADGNDLLNEIEKVNAKFIRNYEEERGFI